MRSTTLFIALGMTFNVYAATPQEILNSYTSLAKQESSAFKEFSPSRGEQFYHAKRIHSSGNQMSCAACHTDSPKNAGSHAKTHKEILPLAPAINKERFTDSAKV